MQGDVAPKVWFGTKTFNELSSVGNALFALPSEGSLLSSSLKVLRILKGLFQKSLKQVRTESATFVWAKPATLNKKSNQRNTYT